MGRLVNGPRRKARAGGAIASATLILGLALYYTGTAFEIAERVRDTLLQGAEFFRSFTVTLASIIGAVVFGRP
jgi:hypothetical protein